MRHLSAFAALLALSLGIAPAFAAADPATTEGNPKAGHCTTVEMDEAAAQEAGFAQFTALTSVQLKAAVEAYNAAPGDQLDPATVTEGYVTVNDEGRAVIVYAHGDCVLDHFFISPPTMKKIFGDHS